MPSGATCITIGNFDGVHLGHQSLISLAEKIALSNDLEFALVTFWPHPRQVLKGGAAHRPLLSRAEKLRILAETGANRIIEMPFTQEFSQLSAVEFVRNKLLPLGMKELVVGHDFSLGHGREGNIEKLDQLGAKLGFRVTQAAAFSLDGKPVSSTRLRQAIAAGDVASAARMLGRRYSIAGTVGRGFGRGAKLGFPTANLKEPDVLVPGAGVYATLAQCGQDQYKAVTNIGTNPTFGNADISIETFLLDAQGDFYDQPLRLTFIDRLRPERKFASIPELTSQIERDVEKTSEILKDNGF